MTTDPEEMGNAIATALAASKTPSTAPKPISLKTFLETIPPGRVASIPIDECAQPIHRADSKIVRYDIFRPDLILHCKICDGNRQYTWLGPAISINPGGAENKFVSCACKNCGRALKIFAMRFAAAKEDETAIEVFKYGENPVFGPPTPRRVLTILEGEKDYFLKGRQAENQSLGIAAFAYYRRVIEAQRNRIFDEIIRVAEKLGAPADMVADIKAAKSENQFKKSIETIRHGIPQALMINGANPLTLLHNALSAGLHAGTDEECLEYASSIRVVLTELVRKISDAVNDEAELGAAVAKLLSVKLGKDEADQ